MAQVRLRWAQGRGRQLLALACLCVITGCASVPDSGEPVAVPEATRTLGQDPDVNVAVPGPRPGGSPAEAVAGLISASGITQNRARLGNAFFMPSARTAFQATDAAWVVHLSRSPAQARMSSTTATVDLAGEVTGEIDDHGVYQGQSRALNVSLKLTRTGQTWLIDSAPPAVLVFDADFGRAFRAVTLYFPAATSDSLVPEARYVDGSVTTNALATPMVTMLLAGPSGWLAPVVRSTAPQGTHLRGNVTAEGEGMIIDFSSELESASAAAINVLAAQIGWSLRPYMSGALRLLVNGRPLGVKGAPSVQTRRLWGHYNRAAVDTVSLYGVKDGGVVRASSRGADRVDGAATAKVTDAAISLDESALAVVQDAPPADSAGRGTGQRELRIGSTTGPLRSALRGDDISRPSWGSGTAGALVAADGVLYRVSRDGTVAQLDTSAIGQVWRVRLALDGVRVLLVAGDHAHPSLYLALLSDAPNGSASLLAPRALTHPLAQLTDVGWFTSTSVLVTGLDADGATTVWEVELDGSATRATPHGGLTQPPLSLASIATEPYEQSVYLELRDHVVQRFRESWTPLPASAELCAPFYPG